MIPRCLWVRSVYAQPGYEAEALVNIDPILVCIDDLLVTLQLNDVAIVSGVRYDGTVGFEIWKVGRFDTTTSNNADEVKCIKKTWDNKFVVWTRVTNFSGCAGGIVPTPASPPANLLAALNTAIYQQQITRATTPVEQKIIFEDTTEANFTEEAGASLTWQTAANGSGVCLSSVSDPTGGNAEWSFNTQLANTYVASGDSVYPPVLCLRDNPDYFLHIDRTGANQYTFKVMKMNAGRTAFTVFSSVVSNTAKTAGFATVQGAYYTAAIGGLNMEYVAVGFNQWTGSKTSQGYVELLKINADFTISWVKSIEAPVPTRNGYFGYGLAFSIVDDTVLGEDVHLIIGTPATSSLYIFNLNSSWVIKQTLTTTNAMTSLVGAALRNKYYATMGATVCMFKYTSNTWSLNTSISSAGISCFGVFTEGGVDHFIYNNTTGYWYVYEWGIGYYSLLYSDTTTRQIFERSSIPIRFINKSFYGYYPSSANHVWKTTSVGAKIVYVADMIGSNGINQIYCMFAGTNFGTVNGLQGFDSSTGMLFYWEHTPTIAYPEGSYHFSATALSKFVIPANVVNISSGAFSDNNYFGYANCSVRYAISLDEKVTWKTCANGTTLTNISSLAAVETEGGLTQYWGNCVSLLPKLTTAYNVYLAVAIVKTAGAAANTTPQAFWAALSVTPIGFTEVVSESIGLTATGIIETGSLMSIYKPKPNKVVI